MADLGTRAAATRTAGPGATAPEPPGPGPGTPEAGTPEAGTPEAGTPETATPEAATPGSAGPPAAPEAARPETAAPGRAAAPLVPAGSEPAPARTGPRRPILRGLGVGFLLLSFLVLGFAGYLYGLSTVQEARDQAILYQRMQVELANEVAPLGPTTPGAPVAILSIPAIGVDHVVVVEGTSSENLTLGPGHLRDTPLPGQFGVSQIFGRRATFGAPFADLALLRRGNVIRIITGQGTATYIVAAVGDSRHVIRDPAPNRLVLLTASSDQVPTYYVDVDARLISHAQAGLAPANVINAAELPLAGDSGGLGLTMAWGLALALVSAVGTIAVIRWSTWPAYLAIAPVVLAVLWNLYGGLAALLPNVF